MSGNGFKNKIKSGRNGILRMSIVVLAFLVQVALAVSLFTWLNNYSSYVQMFMSACALVTVTVLYSTDKTSAMKMPWIIMILLMPIFGITVYYLVGYDTTVSKMKKRYIKTDGELLPLLPECSELLNEKKTADPVSTAIANYLVKNSGYPAYNNSDTVYFDDAEKGFEAQLEAMAKAEKFIFMEYHAIENAESWDRVMDVLEDRVSHGVEVRILYDDMGSIGFVDVDFAEALENAGIKCRVFNPFHFGRNIFLNNRDHRKITVIDGYIGFTGGYNIANEYFNVTHPYGQWKDTGVCIFGDAVKNLSAMFLEMWNASEGESEDYSKYLAAVPYTAVESDALIQPYGEIPTDDKHIGEDVYISMVGMATEYCWFMTPYLIITDEMQHALSLAARRGVDVRIITPGIPDKKIVYNVTRSFYKNLMKNGVKIYEWSPGFCHAKMCVTDDKRAICGTINLDYRSLYHHFEDAVFMSGCSAVGQIRTDLEKCMAESRIIGNDFFTGFAHRLRHVGQLVLRVFAELL